MAKGKVINNIRRDGVEYKKGDTIEADKEVIDALIEAGAVKDPNVKTEESTVDDTAAQKKADQLVADAEKQLADAKAEAEKIVEQAGKDAEATAVKAREEAETVLADAKAEAEKIVKAAQEAAKKASESKTGNQSK
ncbi:hypothetical protein [Mycolicibacterium sp. S3B2]|uniref:hypothetical protein n=1 Tax=Mycolicibacterium sp. S3B2 TaxID=3415120 RepID=UPI003C7AB9E3